MKKPKKTKQQISCFHKTIQAGDLICPECQIAAQIAVYELFEKTMSTNKKIFQHYGEMKVAPPEKYVS